MKFPLITLLTTSLLTFQGVSAYDKFIPAADPEKAIRGEWIVVMKEEKDKGANGASFLASDAVETFDAQAASNFVNSFNLSSKKMKIKSVYSNSIKGFTMSGLKAKDAKKFSMDSRVRFVEQNAKVSIDDYQWGLDRIDQRDEPLDKATFEPLDELDGTGITAYVIDTGIRITHGEFGKRARWGINESGDGKNFDCNGHGTHVASTVGGEKYGVAKNVTLVAVKVLDCNGSGTYAGVIKGIEWTMNDAKNNLAGKKATANLSLGGPESQAVDTAVRNLHASGVPTIAAAGNSNKDACTASPARERSIITVGSTDIDDKRSSFSNFGQCVDIFAPGGNIKGAWYNSDNETKTISGTSMASPHVCGAVALLLQSGISSEKIGEYLKNTATDNKITDAGSNSPNKLLYIGYNRPTNAPTMAPPTAAPTPCPESSIQISITTDEYPDETSFVLKNECDESKVLERAPGFFEREATTYVEDMCVPAGKYKFTIHDSWDDGLCCDGGEGSYKVSYNGKQVAEGAEFETEESTIFGSCDNTEEEEWHEIFKEDFEKKRGHIRGSVVKKFHHNGEKSLRLVGKNKHNKAYTGNINRKVKGYNKAKIEFYAQTKGLAVGDGIQLSAIIGTGQNAKKEEIAKWVVGEEISENDKWVALETIMPINNDDDLAKKLEFSLTKPQRKNRFGAYIDDLIFSGYGSSSTVVPTAAPTAAPTISSPISSPPTSAGKPVFDMVDFENSAAANKIFMRPQIVNLQDNEGNNIKVAKIENNQKLRNKGWIEDITSDKLKLDFSFYFNGKAAGDKLEIQFRFRGSSWKTVETWTVNEQFTNNEWYDGSVTVATEGKDEVRFRFNAVQQAGESIYFDDIILSSLD